MIKTVWGLLGTLVLTTAAHAVPIVIQVNGPDDKPVANAEVRAARLPDADLIETFFVLKKPQYETARTDDKGIARFDWPEPKTSMIPGEAGKYMGTATVWAPTLGAANTILRPGDNTIKLAAVGFARGTVRDAKGAPVAGVKVRALGAFEMPNNRSFAGISGLAVPEDEAAFIATSDEQGNWQIGNLPLGARARVQLEGDAYAADTAFAPIVPAAAPVVADASVAGATTGISQNGELRIAPAATITGRVLNPAGEPVKDVMVWARPVADEMLDYQSPHTALSDEKGEYQLTRLSAGAYKVALRTPSALSLVADNSAPVIVNVESGQSATVPEQKLIEGSTITVQVSDAKTRQPVSDVSALVLSADGRNFEIPANGNSDAMGNITLHVAPGSYRVQLMRTPENYVLDNQPGETVKIAQGETKNVAVKLEVGVLATGRLADEKGFRVPGTTFSLISEKAAAWNGAGILSDAKGEWKTRKLSPGRYKVSLNQSELWELVGPKTLEIPGKDAIEIKVKPITQTQLSGRVVDSEGKGVAGVAVQARITIQTDDYQTNVERQTVSDEKGDYTLPQFPASAKTVVISPTRAGYALQKAPEIKNENKVWNSTDTVMQALSSHLGGTVVNAQNEAQKGVQVLVPRFNSVAVSDAVGAWKFDAIAPGETEIVAVGAAGGGTQTVTAGRDDVQLKLQPLTPAAPRDIDGAIAVLDDAWQTSNGRKYYSRESLPATVAPYDADAALAMARGGDAKASDASILQIVQSLAKTDSERAREWAPQVLAAMEKPENKLSANLMLAKALADAHPDEAKTYLQASSALYDDLKDNFQKHAEVAKIAVLKAKLKEPDAPLWFERTLELASEYRDYSLMAWRVAEVSADWATQVIEAAIKVAPDLEKYGQSPSSTAAAAIRRLATWDIDAAQQMLDKYSSLKGRYDSDYEMDRARATILIERFKTNNDVEAALKSARELNSSKIRTLSQIADLAPPERRAEILREALKLARANSYQQSQAIRIAWQLLPYDRDFAQQTLDEIRLAFNDYNADRDRYSRSNNIGWWAYAYRSIDATQSRWLVEREWARVNNDLTRAPNDNWQRARDLQSLVLAMATVDMPRAQQMTFSLPIDEDGGAPFASAQVLARWMLASQEERQTRPFDNWYDNYSEDGLYANMW